ncbi:hypothetical protein MSPP1_001753 [Malassezia sp. CBS 17886]|nr:hypothetical protein MSPP1_001753 [Malassezia sp. CBS 17886]
MDKRQPSPPHAPNGTAPLAPPRAATGLRAHAAADEHATHTLGDTGADLAPGASLSAPTSGTHAKTPARPVRPPGAPGSRDAGAPGRMTPAFTERFLFDDELDAADDSAFARKYNLATEDELPVFLQPNAFSTLSTFSSALDLAPLSNRAPRAQHLAPGGSTHGAAAMLSPWLHAAPGDYPPRTAPDPIADLAAGAGSMSLQETAVAQPAGARPFVPELFADVERPPLPAGAPSAAFALPLAPGARGARLVGGVDAGAPRERFSRYAVRKNADENARSARKGNARTYTADAGAGVHEGDPAAARGLRRSDVDLSLMRLEDLRGELPQLCKDQYGCRFLQKKLEEDDPAQCELIFAETFPYFADLMTDPFGNYLCQKLLEYCTNAQRDQIVDAIADELVAISLNMHGTRAVQKTIDFLSTPQQTHAIIAALTRNVVTLIKDLNGNHVIQKCLNRLSAADNQFIYDAVAAQCMDVATHRHGCCVLQRCIDHASPAQRFQLVQEITLHALPLVQDPFGNYVVQYVLDLNDPAFNAAVTQQFLGHVCLLSAQKFSSNVIEKCIRVSPTEMRTKLVNELIDPARLESLLRDSFANYVVQTSLDYAEPLQRAQLVECIRPILPHIRNTPYGKRIQSKLQRESDYVSPGAPGAPGAPRFARGHAAYVRPPLSGGFSGRAQFPARRDARRTAPEPFAPADPSLYAPLHSVGVSAPPVDFRSGMRAAYAPPKENW